MKNVLITGAAGFIGSHLCDLFLDKNYNVTGFDNLITGRIQNIEHLKNISNFDFIESDLAKGISIKKKFDYILHFACPASPKDYMNYPLETLKVLSHGTENILNKALNDGAKILLASTSEIYGDPLEHPQKESYYGNVSSTGIRSVYDEGKRFLEAMTYAYHRKYNLDVRIVRIFNTYGKRMKFNDGRVIPSFFNQIKNNNKLTVFGDGNQTRSFCYIDDLVNGIYRLLECHYPYPINIGNPEEITILELIKEFENLYEKSFEIDFHPLPENDPKRRNPDISLANKLIEWKPEISISKGLKKCKPYYDKIID